MKISPFHFTGEHNLFGPIKILGLGAVEDHRVAELVVIAAGAGSIPERNRQMRSRHWTGAARGP